MIFTSYVFAKFCQYIGYIAWILTFILLFYPETPIFMVALLFYGIGVLNYFLNRCPKCGKSIIYRNRGSVWSDTQNIDLWLRPNMLCSNCGTKLIKWSDHLGVWGGQKREIGEIGEERKATDGEGGSTK